VQGAGCRVQGEGRKQGEGLGEKGEGITV